MSEQIQKIGNYVLLEKIAVGGMAEVFLAKMISSDRLVAIKKILPNHSTTNEYVKLFQEEVKVSLNLRHGNIISFLDYIFEKNELYLVMEFVNGMTLRKLIGDLRFKKSKLNLAQCLFIASEIADGLDHAHRAVDSISHKKLNVIHRDMNPQNVMIGFDGGIKIIDFGIAKADSRADVTKVGTIKGKFSYMSPEQALAQSIDNRTDIYALGIVLWELLTGQKLHEGKNDLDTLKKIRATVVRSAREVDPRIPVEIDRVVMQALERDPAARYQRISDFRYDLNQLLFVKFPEFRPSDFSEFIGGMYADLIKSRIEKLSYFAKVKFEKNVVVSTSVAIDIPTGAFLPTDEAAKTNIELPEGFESQTAQKKKEKLDFQDLKNDQNIFAAEVKTHTKQKASHFFGESKPVEVESNDPSLTKFLENSVVWNLKYLALLIVVIYAAVSVFRQFVNPNVDEDLMTLDQASKARLVSADPTKRDVVPTDLQQVSKEDLKQDDFSAKFFKKMKASGKLSYANINIENETAKDTNIFVDGKLIYDKAPIRRFPVYANQVTTITAYNPRLKLYDERKVVIPAGRTMNVKLLLRPYRQ